MSVLYSTKVTATGGRDGKVEAADGNLHANLSIPKAMGGPGKPGATNPEQLFAAGYSACFASAIQHVARLSKTPIGAFTVEAEVGLEPIPAGFALLVSLHPSFEAFEGLESATRHELVRKAHQVCPYSNATRGNIDVKITVNGEPLAKG